MIALNNRQVGILLMTGFLLLLPLIAMRFSTEVSWGLMDFVVAGVMLLTTAFTGEWIIRKVTSKYLRYAMLILGVMLFLLVWVELAVGILGSPLAGD